MQVMPNGSLSLYWCCSLRVSYSCVYVWDENFHGNSPSEARCMTHSYKAVISQERNPSALHQSDQMTVDAQWPQHSKPSPPSLLISQQHYNPNAQNSENEKCTMKTLPSWFITEITQALNHPGLSVSVILKMLTCVVRQDAKRRKTAAQKSRWMTTFGSYEIEINQNLYFSIWCSKFHILLQYMS